MIDNSYNCYNGKAKNFNAISAILLTKEFGEPLKTLKHFYTDTIYLPDIKLVGEDRDLEYFHIYEN